MSPRFEYSRMSIFHFEIGSRKNSVYITFISFIVLINFMYHFPETSLKLIYLQYDPRFGDAFWNSSRFTMIQYLYMMMSSWAIVCDVWYLPPMYRKEDESAIDFANRVKSVIARQGGLVDLQW